MGFHPAFAGLALLLLSSSWACQQSNDDAPNRAGAPAQAGSSAQANGGSSSGGGGAHSGGDDGGADLAGLRGSVVVSMVAATTENEGYSAVLGRFFDGPTPPPIPLVLDTEEGDCQLFVPLHPFCETPCTPAVCTADDVCTPYPTTLAVGSLTIDGLGDTLELEPSTSMFIYQSPSLPYPPCSDGEPVSVSAQGFALEAECIAPLELRGPDPIPVMTGNPVSVSWVAARPDARSRIRIGLDVAHHGGKKGEIDCDVPDTGSFDIPEPLVTKLISLGLAGYPTISVSRVSVGSDATRPELVLLVTESLQRAVDTGVKSCQEDGDCTPPEMCAADRACH